MKMESKKEKENNSQPISNKKNTNMLLAAFMIFIFPMVITFLAVFIGGYIGTLLGISVTTSRILGGILGFSLSAIIIKLFDKSAKADENSEKIHWDDL